MLKVIAAAAGLLMLAVFFVGIELSIASMKPG